MEPVFLTPPLKGISKVVLKEEGSLFGDGDGGGRSFTWKLSTTFWLITIQLLFNCCFVTEKKKGLTPKIHTRIAINSVPFNHSCTWTLFQNASRFHCFNGELLFLCPVHQDKEKQRQKTPREEQTADTMTDPCCPSAPVVPDACWWTLQTSGSLWTTPGTGGCPLMMPRLWTCLSETGRKPKVVSVGCTGVCKHVCVSDSLHACVHASVCCVCVLGACVLL